MPVHKLPLRTVVVLLCMLVVCGCGVHADAPAIGPVLAAALPHEATLAPPARSLASVANTALATLEHTLYLAPGRWALCIPNTCGNAARDWGADSLTYTLYFRWNVARDASIVALMAELAETVPAYGRCDLGSCRTWSDIPMWDAIAALREFEVVRNPATLRKARRAFAFVDGSNAFARGACPAIDFQKPGGGKTGLKTLETDANYIKAGLLLLRWTGERSYLQKALVKYAAVRRYFLDPALPLYTVYVFDDGRRCVPVPRRSFASVNGTMISNGLALTAATGNITYRHDALATARAVADNLSDAAGVYANLQADNDIVEPLVEAMYELAADAHFAFARTWLLTNAAAAVAAPSGAYGRFFGGPAPSAAVSAWAVNGGLALAIAAGALNRNGPAASTSFWQGARFVEDPRTAVPGAIAFTGRAIALIGTIGDTCCEPGHVRVLVDGRETADATGIWQNKSSAQRRLPDSVLWSWRWPVGGRHTIAFEPGIFNPKEGGSYLRLRGYEFVP